MERHTPENVDGQPLDSTVQHTYRGAECYTPIADRLRPLLTSMGNAGTAGLLVTAPHATRAPAPEAVSSPLKELLAGVKLPGLTDLHGS
jgi:hypothetical protein